MSRTPEIKMGVLLGRSPARKQALVTWAWVVVPSGLSLRGPDMSLDMRQLTVSDETAGSDKKNQKERLHRFIESLNFCGAHIFPSVFTAIQIAACSPLTVVHVERSFSTLRILKTYLRNTMGEDPSTGLH